MFRRNMRTNTRVVAVVVAMLSVGLALACGPGTTRYIALGDSIAEGRGATDEERLDYVGLFNQFYAEDHDGPEILTTYVQENETSASIMENQVANAVQVIGEEETDVEVVTLTIGGNDFLPLAGQEPCASNPSGLECQAVVGNALMAFSVNYPVILGELKAALDADPGEEQFWSPHTTTPIRAPAARWSSPRTGSFSGVTGSSTARPTPPTPPRRVSTT